MIIQLVWSILFLLATSEINDPRLYNVQQLTFSGSHSFPRFSSKKRYIYFSANSGEYGKECDEVYRMDLKYINKSITRISTGLGHATHLAFSKGASSEKLFYESSFETAVENVDKPWSCPESKCSGNTPDTKCSENHIEYFPGTEVYGTTNFGSPATRISKRNPNGFSVSFDQYDSFFGITKDCSNKIDVGGTSTDVSGACLSTQAIDNTWSNTNLKPGYYDFMRSGKTVDGKLKVFFSGREIKDNEGTNFIFKTDGTSIQYGIVDENTITSPEVFVAADTTNQKSNLYPHPYQKASSVIFTQLTKEGKGVLMMALKEGDCAAPLTSDTVSSMQSDLNEEENQILFVRKPEGSTDYQVFLASLDKAEHVMENFTAKEPVNDNKNFDYIFLDSHIQLEGKIGRARLAQMGSDLFFEYRPNSPDDKLKCKQIYHVNTGLKDYSSLRLISTGLGDVDGIDFYRVPEGHEKKIIYASNFMKKSSTTSNDVHGCEPVGCDAEDVKNNPDLKDVCDGKKRIKYLSKDFDLYQVNKYGNFEKRITKSDDYNGEPSISPDSQKLVFSRVSDETGSLIILPLNLDGDVKTLTSQMGIGYYGGASFSPDGKNITFHGTIPSDENIPAFQKLLSEHRLVDISVSEIFTIDVETNEFTQITFDGKSNQNPIYTKDGKSIIFERTDEDNKHSLWQINLDGRKKQIELTNEYGLASLNPWKLSFASNHEDELVFIGDLNNEDKSFASQINFGKYMKRPHVTTRKRRPRRTTTPTSVIPVDSSTVTSTTEKNDDRKDENNGALSSKIGGLPLILIGYGVLRNQF